MKRGLVFAKYGTQAASTRQRITQAEPYLNAAGITLEVAPLFDNAYLAQLFGEGKRDPWRMMAAYLKRLRLLLSMGQYDFLWVHYELFPYLPGALERLIGWADKPVLYDYDDATFHQYDQHKNPFIRALLGNKLAPLLRRSDVAMCGNAYLRAYADRYCKRTEIIPTVVDVEVYQPKPLRLEGKPVLGWIGSPSTWSYGKALAPVLTEFVQNDQLSVLVVGAGHAADKSLPFEFRDWVEEREVADVQAMDIGIMPIPDAPWARGKCGYKLIQYMACGLPVIASPVGVNTEIVQHGVNGFLASTESEWREAIARLAGDAELRARMGQAGRQAVEEKYSIQRYGPRIAQLIQEIC